MIKRAFRHGGSQQYFVQTDAGKTFCRNDPLTGIEQVLSGVIVASIHG